VERCLSKGERRQPRRGDGAAAPAAGGNLPAAKEGGDPWGAATPCPPSSLELLGAVEEPSPLEIAAKGEAIS
jgi:hypothetical protein